MRLVSVDLPVPRPSRNSRTSATIRSSASASSPSRAARCAECQAARQRSEQNRPCRPRGRGVNTAPHCSQVTAGQRINAVGRAFGCPPIPRAIPHRPASASGSLGARSGDVYRVGVEDNKQLLQGCRVLAERRDGEHVRCSEGYIETAGRRARDGEVGTHGAQQLDESRNPFTAARRSSILHPDRSGKWPARPQEMEHAPARYRWCAGSHGR